MSERGAYVMKRKGCLIESQMRNTARLQEELVPRITRPAGILSVLFVYLCCSVDRGWLPVTLSMAGQFQPYGEPVFPSQFQIPQDSGIAFVRCLSLIHQLWPGSGGQAEQACLPLLTPEE